MKALRASFRGFEFWAIQWSGQDGRRIVKHAAYGRDGLETEDTGSDGREDQITALLTVAEYNQFRRIIHEKKIGQFTHPKPGMGSWRARANIGGRQQADGDMDRLTVQLTFTEDTAQPPVSPYSDETPTSKKNQAANLFADADDTMSGSPGNDDTQTLYAAFTAAREDYDAQVTAHEAGTASWQDVERAVGMMKSTGWAVIDNLRSFDTYQEDASQVVSYINRGLNLAHEYVEAIKQGGQQWFKVLVVNKPRDLFTLCTEVYDDDPASGLQKVSEIVARNDVLDQMYLPVDTVLEFPYL